MLCHLNKNMHNYLPFNLSQYVSLTVSNTEQPEVEYFLFGTVTFITARNHIPKQKSPGFGEEQKQAK